MHDVEELKASSRLHGDQMDALSVRMDSLSETMAETAKTVGLIAKAMSREATRSRDHERLDGRLAKTLIAFKESSDDRSESRLRRLERSGTRH